MKSYFIYPVISLVKFFQKTHSIWSHPIPPSPRSQSHYKLKNLKSCHGFWSNPTIPLAPPERPSSTGDTYELQCGRRFHLNGRCAMSQRPPPGIELPLTKGEQWSILTVDWQEDYGKTSPCVCIYIYYNDNNDNNNKNNNENNNNNNNNNDYYNYSNI